MAVISMASASHVVLEGLEVRSCSAPSCQGISSGEPVLDLTIRGCHIHHMDGPAARFDPRNLPFFLLPLSLGGKGALPLFSLMVSSLEPRLSYRPDPKRAAKHGFVGPAAPVALAEYRAALAATEPDSRREA